MKPVLFSFLLICFSYLVSAQSREINGVVFQKGSNQRVSGAIIINGPNNLRSESDGLGLFKIQADIGDTLKVAREGFTDQLIIVSSGDDLVIQLAKPVQLAEVNITGQSKKQELDEIKGQYRKKGSYYAGKPPLLSYIFTPLTALYELVGKTPGQARRFNTYYSREVQQSEIDRRFNSSTIQPITSYDGKDLHNFIQIYRPAFQDLSGWAEYDLVKYIRKSALAFEAAGKPASQALPDLPRAPDLSEKVIKY